MPLSQARKVETMKKTNKKTKKSQKLETKKALAKVKDLWVKQNQDRHLITQQAKDYKKPLSQVIRAYFSNNVITTISYKDCYECNNGSYNYRVFIKSDKLLPNGFINSQEDRDKKTVILLNDKTNHIKCCIHQPASDNYIAF